MTAHDLHAKGFDEATKTKLDIFECYLREWFPVFLPSSRSVLICDFFAGSGSDATGNFGSPLRILNVLAEFSPQIAKSETHVQILFNELNPNKIQSLKSLVSQQLNILDSRLRQHVHVEFWQKEFGHIFLDSLKRFHRQPNLFFIDQYGVKEVSPHIFMNMIRIPRTDFLFFSASSHWRRFADEDAFRKHHPNFPASDLRAAPLHRAHRVVLEYYRSMIPADDDTRLFPFSLKKEGGNIYGLIFGSRHPLGAEKFLKVAWNQDKLDGDANYKEFDPDQGLLFPKLEPEKLSKKAKFEKVVEDYIFQRKEVTNQDLFFLALCEGHPPSHASEHIKRLKKKGKVAYEKNMGCSYLTCIKMKRIKSIFWISK